MVLVEPSLNISAELQAIGRVHRMGQTKSVLLAVLFSITYVHDEKAQEYFREL